MTKDSKPNPDTTPARAGDIRSNTPGKPGQRDPSRRDFGDRTDEASRERDPSSFEDERESEGRPYAAGAGGSNVRDQGARKDPARSTDKDQRSGSGRQDEQKKPDAKYGQGQQPARKGPESERDAKR